MVPFLVTAGLLLLPLAPAAFLYKVLTPKRRPANGKPDTASGNAGIGYMTLGGIRLKFNVVGSSATYITLLVVAWAIYERTEAVAAKERLEEIKVMQAALADQQAWQVRVPVMLRDQDRNMLPANNGELQAVKVELEPAVTTADATMIQFWVVPNNRRFPSARFNLTQGGKEPVVLDLNNDEVVEHNYDTRVMESINPVWIETGSIQPYSPPSSPPQPAPVPAPNTPPVPATRAAQGGHP
jgi:hypothetical protein